MSDSTAVPAEHNVQRQTAEIIPFSFGTQQVRTLLIDGLPWFVAADVCASLAIGNVSLAVNGRADRETDGLDEDEKGIATVNTPSGAQEMLVVNESGLYALIFKSRKAEAKRFKKWVTAEVLPAIRKYGRYEDTQGVMTPMVDELLGKTGAMRLSNVMRCRVAKLDAEHQRSATAKLASAVHACFGVPRVELIPSSQFEAAANFVASYAIEGEYIPRQSSLIPEKLGQCDRYLISADPKGNTQISPVPMGAFVLTRQQFMKSMLVDGDMPVSTAEMFEFVALATENLRRRSLYQAARRAVA